MYCRNCGNEINDKAVVCVNCGVPPLAENKFCPSCGAATQPNQVVCIKCGTSLASHTFSNSSAGSSQVVALLLCIFIGGLGIHRFYLGYTWQGVVQLLTLGGCGIWVLIDLIRIIIGDLKPKGGMYTQKL